MAQDTIGCCDETCYGLWHHIAVSYQSNITNGTVIYIDGVAVATATRSIPTGTSTFKINYQVKEGKN